MFLFFSLAEQKSMEINEKSKSPGNWWAHLEETQSLIYGTVCSWGAVSISPARDSSVYTGHYFPLFSQPPLLLLLPFGASATGRDSLESKVTFIQLSEWVSPLECIPDKDFYSAGNSPESCTDSP